MLGTVPQGSEFAALREFNMPHPGVRRTIAHVMSNGAEWSMATSLYRKHRPRTLAEISGQRHILTTLRQELALDRVAHAYLFAGPRGTGKTTTSRILAKAVNCLQRAAGKVEPCNACAACVSISEGNALDVVEIDAASHTGVDHVREHIITGARVTPTSLKRKVFIIDEVHMLSVAAFNALLKTLEEPPGDVLFILATTEVGKLPATVISRCQRFDFKKVSAEDILERLARVAARERRDVTRPVLEAIVAHADGSVRDAESLLEQVLAVGEDPVTLEQAGLILPLTDVTVVLELISALVARQVRPALAVIDRVAREGMDVPHFAATVTAWLRALLLLKSGAPVSALGVECTAEQARQLQAIVEPLNLSSAVAAISAWTSRGAEMKYALLPQLPLELAVVDICLQGGGVTLASPSRRSAPAAAVTPVESLPKQRNQKPATHHQPAAPGVPPARKTAASKSMTAANSPATPPPAGGPALGKSESSAASIGLAEVKKLWPAVLAEMKTQNYSLFSVLRVVQPVNVVGAVVQLGGAYDFHLERLSEHKNREIVERVLTRVHGMPLRVEGVMVSAAAPPGYVAQDAALQTLLEGFGGKVVE